MKNLFVVVFAILLSQIAMAHNFGGQWAGQGSFRASTGYTSHCSDISFRFQGQSPNTISIWGQNSCGKFHGDLGFTVSVRGNEVYENDIRVGSLRGNKLHFKIYTQSVPMVDDYFLEIKGNTLYFKHGMEFPEKHAGMLITGILHPRKI